MREIKYIVLHCTATSAETTVSSIQNYWRTILKWKSPGYHYLIEKNGTIHNLQNIELPTNGVAGYNANAIHISYIGGVNALNKAQDTRTINQVASQIRLLTMLKEKFPSAQILGHRDFPNVKKECPSFDVKKWLQKIEFP